MTVEKKTEEKNQETVTPPVEKKDNEQLGKELNAQTQKLFNQSVEPKKEETPQQDEPKVFKAGSKEFKTQEEADAYIKHLEQVTIEKEIERNKVANPDSLERSLSVSDDDEDYSDLDALMLENPTEYHKKILERAEKRIEKKLNVKETKQAFWDNFYQQHNDLQNQKRIVDLIQREQWDKIKTMTPAQAAEHLAKESRAFIASLKGNQTTVEEVEKRGETLIGGMPLTPGQKKQESKPSSFFDQVKNLQKRRTL